MLTYQQALDKIDADGAKRKQDFALLQTVESALTKLRENLSSRELYNEELFRELLTALFADSQLVANVSKGMVTSDKKPFVITVGKLSATATRFNIYATVALGTIEVFYEPVPLKGNLRPAI